MARTKRGVISKAKHKKVIKAVKGYKSLPTIKFVAPVND